MTNSLYGCKINIVGQREFEISAKEFRDVGPVLIALGHKVVERRPTLLERLSSWIAHTRTQLSARRTIVFRLLH